MILIITGTPGTGKTTLAKRLAKAWGYTYVDVNALLKKKRLGESYDWKRRCTVVDEQKLGRELDALIMTASDREKQHAKKQANLIIDSHLSYSASPKLVDACIVTTCSLKTLYQRLKKKGYSKQKIDDNLECEIMEACHSDAVEHGHDPIIINTAKPISLPRIIALLRRHGGKGYPKHKLT
ncbi:AAA family ATPase [Candidatus Woesearchaeota archaeon]|nr:AAA family ATPase [Candidatus Woesearchaeota archaeon]